MEMLHIWKARSAAREQSRMHWWVLAGQDSHNKLKFGLALSLWWTWHWKQNCLYCAASILRVYTEIPVRVAICYAEIRPCACQNLCIQRALVLFSTNEEIHDAQKELIVYDVYQLTWVYAPQLKPNLSVCSITSIRSQCTILSMKAFKSFTTHIFTSFMASLVD